jgi:transcription initiation factor TFIID subunit 6
MRHARRTTLTTGDIDRALRVLNIEPLYGHSPYTTPVFRRAAPFPQLASVGPVYFVEDEEVDFERVLREEKLVLPPSVRWTAHWLAVEGVQPLIPENPPAVPRDDPSSNASGTAAAAASDKRAGQQAALVKQVLSRELQLYYDRLTSSILPSGGAVGTAADPTKRTAALASFRHDAGLQPLLPYLVRWVGENVVGVLHDGTQDDASGRTLEVLLGVISALLENATLFVEPYVRRKTKVALHPSSIAADDDPLPCFPSFTKSFPRFSPSYCTPRYRPCTRPICARPPPLPSPGCSRSIRRRIPRSRRAS